MGNLNLWERRWRAEMLAKAITERNQIENSYGALVDKSTEYARSMLMVVQVRTQVVKLWAQSPEKLPGEICFNCDTALPTGCSGIFKDAGGACLLNQKGAPCGT